MMLQNELVADKCRYDGWWGGGELSRTGKTSLQLNVLVTQAPILIQIYICMYFFHN